MCVYFEQSETSNGGSYYGLYFMQYGTLSCVDAENEDTRSSLSVLETPIHHENVVQ
jgi:hypothetical protein